MSVDIVSTERKNAFVRLAKGAFYGLIRDTVTPLSASHMPEPVLRAPGPHVPPPAPAQLHRHVAGLGDRITQTPSPPPSISTSSSP